MVSKGYDGSMIAPKLEPARALRDGTPVPAQIRVTAEWWSLNRHRFTAEEKAVLNAEVCGQSICPRQYWVHATEETRRILLEPRP